MSPPDAGDRGQYAHKPTQIPRRGWKDVLLRVKDQIGEDNMSVVAAGVAFYGLLATFPAISAAVLLYGLAFDPAQVEQQISVLRSVMPADAYGIVEAQTKTVAAQGAGTLSFGLLLSLLLALWGARNGATALLSALNIAYDEKEKRGFLRLNATALFFTIGGIVFLLLAVSVIAAIPAVVDLVGLSESMVGKALLWLRWPVMAIMMIAALAVIYRFGPSRATPRFKWVSTGAVVSTVLWIIGSIAFSLYVTNFGSYNKTFGSLGAVVVLCAGAELNAELERQTLRDSTTGAEKPLGKRGAYAADEKAVAGEEVPDDERSSGRGQRAPGAAWQPERLGGVPALVMLAGMLVWEGMRGSER